MKTLNELEKEMRAVARGEHKAPPPRGQSKASELISALTPTNLEILKAIALERPKTVGELAELTGRAQPNISRALQELAHFGFVRLTRHGQKIRPELVARGVSFDFVEGKYDLVR